MNNEKPKRPTRADVNVEDALSPVVDECIDWDGGKISKDEWVSAIIKGRRYGGNGFYLAKEIENVLMISPDHALVEILDDVDYAIDRQHRELVKKWVSENGIDPTFQKGDRITYREWAGVVNGFDLDEGRYYLKPDGEVEKFSQGGGICVNYEEARECAI